MRDALAWGARALCRNDLDFLGWPTEEQAPICARCPSRQDCKEFLIEEADNTESTTLGGAGYASRDILRMAKERRAKRHEAGEVRKPRPRRVDPAAKHDLTCSVCGQAFRSVSPRARYCSSTCSQRAFIERRREARQGAVA